MALCVLVTVIVAGMALSAFCVGRVFEAREQEQLKAHQTLQADLWARMLTARMEAHQRLLTSIAQGLHTSLLDKPAVLDALMRQDGSILRLFESLHVALPSGEVSHHAAVGVNAEIDVQGIDAMRRTIASGKPQITHISVLDDGDHFPLLLSVPMRGVDGQVLGALAALAKLPVAALMPDVAVPPKHIQYMVLGADGTVLLHSDVAQRGQNIQSVLGDQYAEWTSLSNPLAVNADTVQWDRSLVSRVGLPLPQWQVVVWRDVLPDGWSLRGIPAMVWASLAVGVVLLTALATWLLWGWLAPWPVRQGTTLQRQRVQLDGEGSNTVELSAQHASVQAGAMAMFDALPFAMVLEREGHVDLATPQVAVILGYFGSDPVPAAMEQLFESAQALESVRGALLNVGSFDGTVRLRKKDGDVVEVNARAWTSSQLPDAVVWRLQLPWRQRRSTPLPDSHHIWRDPLTDMPNRESFMWDLQAWVSDSLQPGKRADEASKRTPAQGCLLFVDVDHLGMTNETISRELGDKILQHAGRLVVSYTQPLGRVSRLGGDEFAVLLPGISLAHAQGIGQALCDAVSRWQPTWGGERHWVSISVGVVAVDARRHTPQQAVHAADMACYEAKRRGRCQVAVGNITAQPGAPTAFA